MLCRPLIRFALIGLIASGWVAAQDVEFNYSGRAKASGQAFDGTGLFKFAIVSNDGAIGYWSNDGVTLNGTEPTTSIQIGVSNGFFDVNIGDTTIAGMAALDAAIFNTDEHLRLRVWFSDGVSGFQQMNPDRPINNPNLIGLQTTHGETIYVDPVNGNDRNGGNKPNKAKKTIQAAWDAAPKLVSNDFQIQLADGIYRETATLTGKTMTGGSISLIGNTTTPLLVRVTGAPASDETTITLDTGFTINKQEGLLIKGLSFDHFNTEISITRTDLEMENCIIKQYGGSCGINSDDSHITLTNLEFTSPLSSAYNVGLQSPLGGTVILKSCNFHDMNQGAVKIDRLAQMRISSCTFTNIGLRAVSGTDSTCIDFELPNTTFQNVPTAIFASNNTSIEYYTSHVTYINPITSHLTLLNSSYASP